MSLRVYESAAWLDSLPHARVIRHSLMGLYTDHILPRCIDFMLSRPPILELRARVTQGLAGKVLEVGFGSGLNLPYYPREVTRIWALDPSPSAQPLSAARQAACNIPVHWIAPEPTGDLPLADGEVDAVLSTFTFCTIPQIELALRELYRVLKPCGKLHFLEHGKSPDARVARMQQLFTPLQRRVAGGCHLNRPIDDLLRDAGFCLDALQTYYMPGPKAATHMFEGIACACHKPRAEGA